MPQHIFHIFGNRRITYYFINEGQIADFYHESLSHLAVGAKKNMAFRPLHHDFSHLRIFNGGIRYLPFIRDAAAGKKHYIGIEILDKIEREFAAVRRGMVEHESARAERPYIFLRKAEREPGVVGFNRQVFEICRNDRKARGRRGTVLKNDHIDT